MNVKKPVFVLAGILIFAGLVQTDAPAMGKRNAEPSSIEAAQKEREERFPEMPAYEEKKMERPEPDVRAMQMEAGLIDPADGKNQNP